MVAKHLHMKSFTFTNTIQCTERREIYSQAERSMNNIYPGSQPHQSAFSLLARLISKQSRLDILYPRCCEQFAIEVNIDKLTLPRLPLYPRLPVEIYPAAYWGSAITLSPRPNWSHSIIEFYPEIIFNTHAIVA